MVTPRSRAHVGRVLSRVHEMGLKRSQRLGSPTKWNGSITTSSSPRVRHNKVLLTRPMSW